MHRVRSYGALSLLALALVYACAQWVGAQTTPTSPTDNRPFLACPPGAPTCVARVQCPASPQVDRACLRRFGSGVLVDTLCLPCAPGAEVRIRFDNPKPGAGHTRYEVVACDDDLQLCSEPAAPLAIAVDLDVPTFFEVLRDIAGTLSGS